MIVPRQDGIVEELQRRIRRGDYGEKLPRALDLAQEFGVNVKTLNKALARLVRLGLVERRRHVGTTVRRRETDEGSRNVEIVYNGVDSAFSHPFWGPVFSGAVRALGQAGFHPVLNPVGQVRSQTEKLASYRPLPCGGRIVMGIHDVRFADRLKREPEPFVFAGDSLGGTKVPLACVSARKAVEKTIGLMLERGFARIAFLGDMQIFEDSDRSSKFLMWRDTIRRNMPVDPDLAVHTPPVIGAAAEAVKKLLAQASPDAVFVGFGFQLAEVEQALREAGRIIPVISFDGSLVPGYAGAPQPVRLPLEQCGEAAAKNLLEAMSSGKMPPDIRLDAVWIPENVPFPPPRG